MCSVLPWLRIALSKIMSITRIHTHTHSHTHTHRHRSQPDSTETARLALYVEKDSLSLLDFYLCPLSPLNNSGALCVSATNTKTPQSQHWCAKWPCLSRRGLTHMYIPQTLIPTELSTASCGHTVDHWFSLYGHWVLSCLLESEKNTMWEVWVCFEWNFNPRPSVENTQIGWIHILRSIHGSLAPWNQNSLTSCFLTDRGNANMCKREWSHNLPHHPSSWETLTMLWAFPHPFVPTPGSGHVLSRICWCPRSPPADPLWPEGIPLTTKPFSPNLSPPPSPPGLLRSVRTKWIAYKCIH